MKSSGTSNKGDEDCLDSLRIEDVMQQTEYREPKE